MNYNINEAFACLKSLKRIDILRLLINTEEGLQFSEIAKKLAIIPSTLQYHLKTLEELNLITHLEDIYLKNGYSKLIWNLYCSFLNINEVIPYLSEHNIPIDNPNILLEFLNSDPLVLNDIISLLKLMKNWARTSITNFRIVGLSNLELEEKIMRLSDYAIKIKELEVISTYEGFQKLISYENFDYFFSFTDIKNIKLFLVKKCNFYIGIGESNEDSLGILFLPNNENRIDYESALLFRGKKSLFWLNKVYKSLKKKAKEINLTESFLKDRSLFNKYLQELDNS